MCGYCSGRDTSRPRPKVHSVRFQTQAVLVGYRQGQTKSGGTWTLASFAGGGTVVSGFLADDVGLNGQKAALDKGEVIPVDLECELRDDQRGMTLTVRSLKERK